MVGYIKDKKTFSTVLHCFVESYNLYPETSTNKSGSATVIGELPDYSGSWFFVGGDFCVIGQSTPSNGKTTLKLLHPLNIFDRDAVYSLSTTPASTGAYIASLLTSEFISQSDADYRMSYMSVTNTDTTAYFRPDYEDGYIFNIREYLDSARLAGVKITMTATQTGVAVAISTNAAATHSIFLDDGHSKLNTVTFSDQSCAKLTVQKRTDEDGVYTVYTYYRAADGTITTSEPLNRAKGTWHFITCAKDDSALTVAKKHFADNSYEHKIEFYSDKHFDLFDIVNIALPTGVFASKINEIKKSSSDNRYLYTCGSLPTTLTEQVKNNKSKTVTQSIDATLREIETAYY